MFQGVITRHPGIFVSVTTTLQASGRPDLDAYTRSVRAEVPALVSGLRDLLGAQLVAYLGRVKETRAVRQWADGSRAVQDAEDLRRLRVSFHVAGLLAGRDTPAVVQAWFQGMNPSLGDRAPARVLVEDGLDTAGPAVLAAARAFASSG